MTVAALAKALFAILLSTAPPDKTAGSLETENQTRARYEAIALAIATVAEDPTEAPIVGSPEESALVLVAIAKHESSFRADVESGAKRSRMGACGLYQALPRAGRTPEGWTCDDLVADREKAARAAFHRARSSWRSCGRKDPRRALAAYASGSCKKGLKESRAMVMSARRWAVPR